MTNYRVFQDGENTTLSGIFDTYRQAVKEFRRNTPRDISGLIRAPSITGREKLSEMVRAYNDRLSEAPHFRIEIDGHNYSVIFRYVDDDGFILEKPPNVAFLFRNNEDTLVLREARTYDPNSIEVRNLRRLTGGNKFDDRWYTSFGLKPNVLPAKGKFGFIPERYVLAANKIMNQDPELRRFRFVPFFRPLHMDNGYFYYVRRFLPHQADTNQKERTLSSMWFLNLSIFPDSDPQELVIYKEGAQGVYIDPDFLLITDKIPCQRELAMAKGHSNIDVNKVRTQAVRLKDTYPNVRFLDYIPSATNIENTLFDEHFNYRTQELSQV